MKNELNTLKAQSRKTYFDFSPNTQYRTQYSTGYRAANANTHSDTYTNTQASYAQAQTSKTEADPKRPAAEMGGNDKSTPPTNGYYAMS